MPPRIAPESVQDGKLVPKAQRIVTHAGDYTTTPITTGTHYHDTITINETPAMGHQGIQGRSETSGGYVAYTTTRAGGWTHPFL
ncbi:hypothetical protein FQN54_006135 [Arachnomyces sp. PD_36]|nr:hypothetical protein FQN54_006135 [Arachnomyces sp. PD_36]